MNVSLPSRIFLLVTIVILLCTAVAINRDYQDGWILEGLEVPFALFAVTYALTFFMEKKVSMMVALAVVARCVFFAIPNLKYVWFQGTSIDQQQQYGMANYIYNQGHVATQGIYGISVYGKTPLIQLSLAIFSVALNAPVVDAVKYLPVLLSPIYPLATYVIVKNLNLPKTESIMRYALFISSIPISAEYYIITGSQFGVLLVFLALTSLLILLRKNDRRYWLIFIFFVFSLAVFHSVSSFLLTLFLLIALAVQRIPLAQMTNSLRAPVVLAATSICAAWFMFQSTYTFDAIVRSGFAGVKGEISESVSPRFFEVAKVNLLAAFNILLASDGAKLLLLLLASAGLIILLKTWKHLDKVTRSFLLIGSIIFLFIPICVPLGLGLFRLVFFAAILFPIFSGALLVLAFFKRQGKRETWLRRIISSSIIMLIMLVAILGLYGCQPLMPPASVLSKNLPEDQPLGYVTSVNSIYQRKMIEFAQDNVVGKIACDTTTENQVTGLTDFDFSVTHLISYYPLDNKQPKQEYDCFLIHFPGIAGPFENPAETRTKGLILEAINSSDLVYTNGESFVLAHTSIGP